VFPGRLPSPHFPQHLAKGGPAFGTTGIVEVLRREPPIPIPRQGVGLSLCEIDALAAAAGPWRSDAALDHRQPGSKFGFSLLGWSASRAVEFHFRRLLENSIFGPYILGRRLRDLAARFVHFNVAILNLEAIVYWSCVLTRHQRF
jgi:hypothetical protein